MGKRGHRNFDSSNGRFISEVNEVGPHRWYCGVQDTMGHPVVVWFCSSEDEARESLDYVGVRLGCEFREAAPRCGGDA